MADIDIPTYQALRAARISDMRREGRTERDIADALGITRQRLWRVVTDWNRRHPDTPIPPAYAAGNRQRTERAAEIVKKGGDADDVAAEFDVTRQRAQQMMYRARARGLLPRVKTRRDCGGHAAWQHYYGKGAAPPAGVMGTVLNALTTDQIERLLAMLRPGDNTCADLVARILKEHMNADAQG